jgi:hypothetical protein
MDLGKLADEIKHVVDERGGLDSLKEDAGELKDIAKGEGGLVDKAKDAAEAIKDPSEALPGSRSGQASASTASGMSKLK